MDISNQTPVNSAGAPALRYVQPHGSSSKRLSTGIPLHQVSAKRVSGSSVVDNTLNYQSMGREIDPPLLRLSDETLNRGPLPV